VQVVAPSGLQLLGNGDVMSYTEWNEHLGRGAEGGGARLSSCMIGRGALIKPWVRS
jgi:tRNA-dihydrouridine synthase 3